MRSAARRCRGWPRLVVILTLAVIGASCGKHGAPAAAPPPGNVGGTGASSRADLVGVWEHALPKGERYRLSLFASGILGFQHVTSEAPLSRAFGRWTYVDGELQVTVVGSEPDGATFPLSSALAAAVEPAHSLVLEGGGDRSAWVAVSDPYGTAPGVDERAARDERDWAYLVQRAGAPAAE